MKPCFHKRNFWQCKLVEHKGKQVVRNVHIAYCETLSLLKSNYWKFFHSSQTPWFSLLPIQQLSCICYVLYYWIGTQCYWNYQSHIHRKMQSNCFKMFSFANNKNPSSKPKQNANTNFALTIPLVLLCVLKDQNKKDETLSIGDTLGINILNTKSWNPIHIKLGCNDK